MMVKLYKVDAAKIKVIQEDDDDVDDDEDDNEIGAKDWKPQSDRYVWIWRGEANRTSINDFC